MTQTLDSIRSIEDELFAAAEVIEYLDLALQDHELSEVGLLLEHRDVWELSGLLDSIQESIDAIRLRIAAEGGTP